MRSHVVFRSAPRGTVAIASLSLLAPLVSALMASEPDLLHPPALPAGTRQLILVTAPALDSSSGSLQRWDRQDSASPWLSCAPPHPVTLGRAGLAWGLGLHVNPEGAPRKLEGDGKSPAGVFRLGTAFGYASTPPPGCRWPYRQATDRDFFVDDPASPDYNRWITRECGLPESAWTSFERMRRSDGLYRYGLVVEHNSAPPVAGSGSAIFLHIWKEPGSGTSGCTAMAAGDLEALLCWLRPEDHPLLVQVAEPDLDSLRLPSIP